jgi:hypothetical protein
MNDYEQKLRNTVLTILDSELEDVRAEFNKELNSIRNKTENETISTQGKIKNVIEVPLVVRLMDTQAATAANYGRIFIANSPCEVTSASIVYKTAGTSGSAVTLNVECVRKTTPIGSGDALFLYPLSLKATADTVYDATLIGGSSRLLVKGDRLALKLTGTPTTVNDLCVVIGLTYR